MSGYFRENEESEQHMISTNLKGCKSSNSFNKLKILTMIDVTFEYIFVLYQRNKQNIGKIRLWGIILPTKTTLSEVDMS